jgi:hypothetical protein
MIFTTRLPSLPNLSLDQGEAEEYMQGAEWGILEPADGPSEAGLISRAEYFGKVFLAVDVPNVATDKKLLPGEPLLKLAEGEGSTRRLFPFDRVNSITLTDEVDARNEAVGIAFAALAEEMAAEEEDAERAVERAGEKEELSTPEIEAALREHFQKKGRSQSSVPAPAQKRYGGRVEGLYSGNIQLLHGSEHCPVGRDADHRWILVASMQKAPGDMSPEHPAEQKNLAVWAECKTCDAWGEVE